MENLSQIGFNEMLSQSIYARDLYENQLNIRKDAFNNPLVNEIYELYNQCIRTYKDLTQHQLQVLSNILSEVNDIKKAIDPNRLKDIQHTMNEDGDLLFYRNVQDGLVNIIIHPNESFALSYIGLQKEPSLKFYTLEDTDFEHLVLKFFSF